MSSYDHSLFTLVTTTTGIGGDNGATGPKAGDTQQGGELMGFYNMAKGDAPVFNTLAQNFALSDNYHQSIMGGIGANFFAIATGDVAVYNNNGVPATPPTNQIENPNPLTGTENFYTQDGYSGGSYVNCSDPNQPGVKSILKVLRDKRHQSRCEPNAFYLVNNYDSPYEVDGTPKALGADKFNFPPQSVPTIGEALSAKNVSWKWYTAGRDKTDVVTDPLYPLIKSIVSAQIPAATPNRDLVIEGVTFKQTQTAIYNSIGDPHNASQKVVTTPALREHLQGLTSFISDIQNETLPAVSYVVPKNLSSGHPGYSAPISYELFIKELVEGVQSKPKLWANTAIIITTDEGGGYFDTGSIQNIDFFGDGARIPFLVVSPHAKKGYVDHVYHDHASILKFIEYNWNLNPLSKRSRDNLPNPSTNRYARAPSNQPAIGDLTSLFSFSKTPNAAVEHDNSKPEYNYHR